MAVLMIFVMALQLFVIKRQQTHGPRWFAPRRFRINPEAYDYYRDVPEKDLARAKLVSDPLNENGFEDAMTCVICMNYIHYKVDESGGLIRKDGKSATQDYLKFLGRSSDSQAESMVIVKRLQYLYCSFKTNLRNRFSRRHIHN